VALEVLEPAHAAEGIAQDDEGPPLADLFQGLGDGTILFRERMLGHVITLLQSLR
jgi:hypothetical protein